MIQKTFLLQRRIGKDVSLAETISSVRTFSKTVFFNLGLADPEGL